MAEYIERSKVLRILERYGLKNGAALGHHSGAVEMAEQEISLLPASDVQPVVYCKDCKYWGRGECYIDVCDMPFAMNSDDFCSFGERKDSEKETKD